MSSGLNRAEGVLPADAGVFLQSDRGLLIEEGAPRRRGGVPYRLATAEVYAACSPPTRGCSIRRRPAFALLLVLPADAGVFRRAISRAGGSFGAPRRRGGVPSVIVGPRDADGCSPPTRGCSVRVLLDADPVGVLPADAGVFQATGGHRRQRRPVLPADAGVFRRRRLHPVPRDRAPRRRGGVPRATPSLRLAQLCSPPTRGCSATRRSAMHSPDVLPADAGVFRSVPCGCVPRPGAPRRRGGVPEVPRSLTLSWECSPPTRGCSGGAREHRALARVLPADAGVFRSRRGKTAGRNSAPRRRGGVPGKDVVRGLLNGCSPPTRGCSAGAEHEGGEGAVLPADAGVFRCCHPGTFSRGSAPRRRGGVPKGPALNAVRRRCSPPTRGCSAALRCTVRTVTVLPTDAGVFRSSRRWRRSAPGAPRRRGGVPIDSTEILEAQWCSPPTRGCSAAGLEGAGSFGVLPADAGCSARSYHAGDVLIVLPADAGVFRRPPPAGPGSSRAPRQRGCVLVDYLRRRGIGACSPTRWGYSGRWG